MQIVANHANYPLNFGRCRNVARQKLPKSTTNLQIGPIMQIAYIVHCELGACKNCDCETWQEMKLAGKKKKTVIHLQDRQ